MLQQIFKAYRLIDAIHASNPYQSYLYGIAVALLPCASSTGIFSPLAPRVYANAGFSGSKNIPALVAAFALDALA
jgi:hypothetical protein